MLTVHEINPPYTPPYIREMLTPFCLGRCVFLPRTGIHPLLGKVSSVLQMNGNWKTVQSKSFVSSMKTAQVHRVGARIRWSRTSSRRRDPGAGCEGPGDTEGLGSGRQEEVRGRVDGRRRHLEDPA